MPANYVLLEKITVGSAGASSITFSSIPQTGYTDLVVKASTRNDASNNSIYVSLNGSTTSFTSLFLYSTSEPGSASSYNLLPRFLSYGETSTYTASTFASTEMYLPNYTSANYKSWSVDGVAENNATRAENALTAGLWSNTAAITSISLAMASGNFVQYSTFYLYGVAKLGTTPAIVPYATGGDTIMTDGTYWYHTFLSSGTFTPQKSITCDYLVVAGGGGGGQYGGGGGAGGLRSTVTATGGGGSLESALSVASGTGYTVTVGAGGAGGNNAKGTNGSNSVFSTITSTGGGGGGGNTQTTGTAGGSGGGGTFTTGGAGTANQGYAGGTGYNGDGKGAGGGGGGAGAVGGSGTTTLCGNGGNGVATSISGSSVTYAGGGGGGSYDSANTQGSGGTGGGGNANNNAAGSAGTANRGGGGGAGVRYFGTEYVGGAGGSGIVIVRYAV